MFENRIMIKYTLEDAHSATTLRFRPFLAFRSVKELTYANGNLNQNYTVVPNGIKMCLYPGYPELFMQFSKKVNFVLIRNGITALNIQKNRREAILIKKICLYRDILKYL